MTYKVSWVEEPWLLYSSATIEDLATAQTEVLKHMDSVNGAVYIIADMKDFPSVFNIYTFTKGEMPALINKTLYHPNLGYWAVTNAPKIYRYASVFLTKFIPNPANPKKAVHPDAYYKTHVTANLDEAVAFCKRIAALDPRVASAYNVTGDTP